MSAKNIYGTGNFLLNCIFNETQERELVDHVSELQTLMYGITQDSVRCVAYEFAEKKKTVHPFSEVRRRAGRDWVRRFIRRHSDFPITKPEKVRRDHFDETSAIKFYSLLEDTLKENFIPPDYIFNMGTIDLARISNAQSKNTNSDSILSDKIRTTTAICTISATGKFLPPFLAFVHRDLDEKNFSKDGVNPSILPLDWSSPPSFITEIHSEWLDHFVAHCRKDPNDKQKILLILDSCGSRMTLETLDKIKELGIILLTIPPSTREKLQPLDQVFFKNLKENFTRLSQEKLKKQKLGNILSVHDEIKIFGKACNECLIKEAAVEGFKIAGVHPLKSNLDISPKNDVSEAKNKEKEEKVINENLDKVR